MVLLFLNISLGGLSLFGCQSLVEAETKLHEHQDSVIRVGAERMDQYLPFIKSKKIALVANQSSRIGEVHLVDSLLTLGVDLLKIFTPEHGFRGNEDAGAKVDNAIDPLTSLPLISLYGNNKKPTNEQLQGVELIVFDLQDVGVRFYTYLSTLHYTMQAAAENNIPVLVLDRPNPNLEQIDGPMMKEEFMSFVGLHPVPLLYGMSIGEYARMINGEKWLGDHLQCSLVVIGCENLTRNSHYNFPIPPSPNLPNMRSIDLYPSLALFEGTVISVGRGTEKPFQQIGHPAFKGIYNYNFIPHPTKGASNPKLNGKECFGVDLEQPISEASGELQLNYLLEFYTNYPEKEKFFNSFFNLLSGTDDLRRQIEEGATESAIQQSWKQDLDAFHKIRMKYLIY